MKFSSSALLATLFLATSLAQKITTTLDVDDGNTLVISKSTNADGETVTKTLSTIDGDDDDDTSTSTSKTTTSATNRVGTTTSYAPMRTTTYWVDTGDGYWTYYTWTCPTTTVPTVATANVASGSVREYSAYQTSINSAIYAIASAQDSSAGTRAPQVKWGGVIGGWVTLAAGAVGAGLGMFVF